MVKAMNRLGDLVRTLVRRTGATGTHRPTGTVPDPLPGGEPGSSRSAAYPDPDTTPPGGAGIAYTPDPDGEPDPGEVVWAWVPYEDDPAQGKDRPVLLIGRDGMTLLGLQLTSQDHDLDAEDEARYGRHWMDIGSGAWDHERRPSEVRLDRLIRLDEHAVRREGAVLDRGVFAAVVREARTHHPHLR